MKKDNYAGLFWSSTAQSSLSKLLFDPALRLCGVLRSLGKLFFVVLGVIFLPVQANSSTIVLRVLDPTVLDLGCGLIDPACTGATSNQTFSLELTVVNGSANYPFLLFDVDFDFFEVDTFDDDSLGHFRISPDNPSGIYIVPPLSQAMFSYEFTVSKDTLNSLCDTGPCDGKTTILGSDFYHANLGELGELEFFADGFWEFSYGETGTTVKQTRSLDNFITIFTTTPIPEPSSWVLLFLGGSVIAGYRWRIRQRKTEL